MNCLFVLTLISLNGLFECKTFHSKVGDISTVNMKSCGLGVKDKPKSRIINAQLAEVADFPFMASLHVINKTINTFICGAVLINEFWILTARHCLTKGSGDEIPAGSLIKAYLGSVYQYEYEKSFVVIHRYLHPSVDLALLRVMSKIEVLQRKGANDYLINYACLPAPDIINTDAENAEVIGFGRTDVFGNNKSYVLRKAHYSISPPEECSEKKEEICSSTTQSICYGDSGGPLIQMDGNRAVLIGIVESGHPIDETLRCGPGKVKFVRISYFVEWIRNLVENYDQRTTTSVRPTRPTNEMAVDGNGSYNGFRIDVILYINSMSFLLFLLVVKLL